MSYSSTQVSRMNNCYPRQLGALCTICHAYRLLWRELMIKSSMRRSGSLVRQIGRRCCAPYFSSVSLVYTTADDCSFRNPSLIFLWRNFGTAFIGVWQIASFPVPFLSVESSSHRRGQERIGTHHLVLLS